MIDREITEYEQIADKLKHTYKPYATRISHFILMPQVGNMQLIRTLSDCIIELESIKENTEKQLLMYNQKYGEL